MFLDDLGRILNNFDRLWTISHHFGRILNNFAPFATLYVKYKTGLYPPPVHLAPEWWVERPAPRPSKLHSVAPMVANPCYGRPWQAENGHLRLNPCLRNCSSTPTKQHDHLLVPCCFIEKSYPPSPPNSHLITPSTIDAPMPQTGVMKPTVTTGSFLGI